MNFTTNPLYLQPITNRTKEMSMENQARILLEQYERDFDYPKVKRELLLLFDGKSAEWVAISDRLPELEQSVLLFDNWKPKDGEPQKDIRVGYLSEFTTRKTTQGVRHYCEWRGTEFAFNITHWMPLPDFPPLSLIVDQKQ